MLENNRRIDRMIAGVVAVFPIVLLSIWSFPGLHPYVWEDTAIAAGLLPAKEILPGFGVYLAHLIFKIFPYSAALTVVGLLGKVFLGVAAFLMYGIISSMFDIVSAAGVRDGKRRQLASRMVAAVGAFLFACSDPMWHAAQSLTGSTFVIFGVLFSTWLFVRLLMRATYLLAVATLCSLGLLAAETPIGFVLLVLFISFTVLSLRGNMTPQWVEFLNPVRLQRTKWSMTFAFIGTFLLGILLEVACFALLDGLKAFAVTVGELPRLYVDEYFGGIFSSVNVLGAILFFACAVLPVALAFVLIVPATDEERYLSFRDSIVYFVLGLVAFLQLSPFALFWFWNVSPSVSVSRIAILFGVFLDVIALAWALFVLSVEVFCRDYQHIEDVIFQNEREADEDDAGVRKVRAIDESIRSVRLSIGRLSMLLLPLALVLIGFWGRRLPEDRQLQGVVHAFVNETVLEAGDAHYVFTDGSYDPYLRLEARRRGSLLVPVSLMSGDSPREAYVRAIAASGAEDQVSLATGAAETIRTWIISKSERVQEMCAQIAFEFFRLNRHLSPIVYGLLVRPSGGDAEAAAASIQRCHRLADIIVKIQDDGIWRHAKDEYLKDRFLFAQFRLAIMSRLRAIDLDAAKRVKESIEEIAYSDRLNASNPSLKKILKRMDWLKRQKGEDLTPREGLEVAMKRADFSMARRYAIPVIKENPDDPNANFAMGMSYYAEEQFAKAEEYLRRVLKVSPKEPSVHNNLALICLKTDRLDEAKKFAEKALELKNDHPAIIDTLRQVEKAIQEASDPQLKLKKELERRRGR